MRFFLLLVFLCIFGKNAFGVSFSGYQSGSNTIQVTATPELLLVTNWSQVTFTAYNSNGDIIGTITGTPITAGQTTSQSGFTFTINLDEPYLGQIIHGLQANCSCGGGSEGYIPLTQALPITLNSFSYRNNTLYWITESEVNASHFEIESSSDGKNFEWGGKVLASNRSTGSEYSFRIKKLKAYYRLKSVDFDGIFVYSDIISTYLNNEKNSEPIQEGSTWSFDQEDMFLFNSQGSLIQTSKSINVEGLPDGIYILKWLNGYIKISHVNRA